MKTIVEQRWNEAQSLLELLASCKRKGSIPAFLLMCDNRISKRDFIHGVMNIFGVDASSAIEVNRKLSRVHHLFRDEKGLDINCSEMYFVFQSISLFRVVQDNSRKVILSLVENVVDDKESSEADLVMTFKRAILSACVCGEEEIETKKSIDIWVQRFNDQGRKTTGLNFIQDLLDLVPSIEIKFRDNVIARLSHRNKMILLEGYEKTENEILFKTSKHFILKRAMRKMNYLKYNVFHEWHVCTRQLVQGRILRYRMLYWKVHMAILWWYRQTFITKRHLFIEMTIKKSRQHLLIGRIFVVWRRYVHRLIMIRQVCLEQSEMAKNISLGLTRFQIAASYYQKRLLLLRWNKFMNMSRKNDKTKNWYNKMKRLKYFEKWKTFILLQRQDIYRKQVNRELSAIQCTIQDEEE